MYFRQIFANILSNAVKYNKIHGKITLRVDMVSRTEDDVVYRFSVSDTGIGMSEEFQKHILKHLHKRIQERVRFIEEPVLVWQLQRSWWTLWAARLR